MKTIEDKPLNLRFCHPDEVDRKQQKFLTFKQSFFVRQEFLKFQGQKLHTMVMVNRYLDENIDAFFKDRPKQLDYRNLGPKNFQKHAEKLRKIEQKKEHNLEMWEQRFLEKEKQVYLSYLLQEANRMIKLRRIKLRVKHIEDTKKACGKTIKYAKKNAYIEDRIEVTVGYFNYMNDLNHKGQDIVQLQKKLFDFKRSRAKKQQTGQSVDPSKLLDDISSSDISPDPIE